MKPQYRMGVDAYADQKTLIEGLKAAGSAADCVLDVGANVGNTVERYMTLFPAAQIHAIEAAPDIFQTLKRRFREHPRVLPFNSAISDRTGTLEFQANHDSGTSSLLKRPAAGRRYYNKQGVLKEKLEVPSTTLDQYCQDRSLQAIDILKLDTQGSELMILRGADALLSKQAFSLIYSEVQFVALYEQAPLFHEVWQNLLPYGYSLYGIYDPVIASNGQLRFADAIFIHPKLREVVLDLFDPEPY